MKWLLSLYLFVALPLAVTAQNVDNDSTPVSQALRFGYLSFSQALQAMPDYGIVQQQLSELRQQYEAEAKRVEDDFNRKYEQFLDGMKDFPPTILQKRQRELQDMMERNIAFKQQSRLDLRKAEADALVPLRSRLSDLLATIGHELQLAFIINTDNDACPYIDSQLGINLNDLISERLAAK